MSEIDKVNAFLEKEDNLMRLRGFLGATDYLAIKYAEGLLTDEEYAPYKAQRQKWREEINALQGGD